MLRHEDNVLITHTNPGTPMGDLFRYYWIPCVGSEELVADGKPLQLKLLGEDLVAFRDSEGKVGLVDERCPHRGTSLAFGINAGCGLTCMYHGWKFDVNGDCIDLPSEPESSGFRNSIRLKSYPTHEANGIIWAYMGPAEKQPPVPDFYWMNLPEENVMAERVWQDCNYLQVMENDVDYVHAAFLHKAHNTQSVEEGVLSSDLGIDPNHPLVKNPPVKQAVESTNYGKRYIGVGKADETTHAFMEIHYIFPFYTYPPRFEGEDGMWHAFIPRDDHSTWSWDVQFSHRKPINRQAQHDRRGLNLDKDLRKLRNLSNSYEQDRSLMIDGNFSGIRGIANQDHAATETMGPIVDRSKEHLGTSDMPIIQMRRMLLNAVADLQEGIEPPLLDNSTLMQLYSKGVYAPKEKTWNEALPLDDKYAIKQGAGKR
ncbi:Rieske 2Fe-2S domain-containing protein [Brevibacillus daliensis]|uniref:Rieske 2Fe-2S domain-containing protein n=1 Tax=Brevibacillus daliensis TaxID=2892995 RepID=UPI001E2E2E37|nr:Rieske 2Fe-2S domain-containing protein [Brevibacillus daliensis]